jgi:hypothetical protein
MGEKAREEMGLKTVVARLNHRQKFKVKNPKFKLSSKVKTLASFDL